MIQIRIENNGSGSIHYKSSRCDLHIEGHTAGDSAQIARINTECLEGLLSKLKEYPYVDVAVLDDVVEEDLEKAEKNPGNPELKEFLDKAEAKKTGENKWEVTYGEQTCVTEGEEHHRKAKAAAYEIFFGGGEN